MEADAMKVETKNAGSCQLSTLDDGDTFLDPDDDLCILTDETDKGLRITVVLASGMIVRRDGSQMVTPWPAKAVLDEG
jgi:hypothetical protein